MAENTPADRGSGGAGGRRSGLDRLRAARGDAPAAPAAGSGAADPTSTDEGAVRNAGSTALLDAGDGTRELDGPAAEGVGTDAAESDVADPGAAEAGNEADSEAAEGSRGKSRLRGRRARRAAADADLADTLDEDGAGRRSARRRGRGRAGTTTKEGTASERSSRRSVLLAVGLALLVIALAIPVVGMRHRLIGETKEQRATKALVEKREAGLRAGRQFAVTFFTFDYRKVDDFTRDVKAMTVGDFNADFTKRSGELKTTLQQVQSVASARVLSAGVSKVSGDNVEVLVVVDQDIKNKASQGKTVVQRYRLAVTVQQTPQGWLVNGVNPVV